MQLIDPKELGLRSLHASLTPPQATTLLSVAVRASGGMALPTVSTCFSHDGTRVPRQVHEPVKLVCLSTPNVAEP